MISLGVVLSILFVHWFADFVCQTDWQATNKSKDNSALLQHTATYTFMWLPLILILGYQGTDIKLLLFFPITFICHTITDYFTSRVNSKLWERKQVHSFFVSVGFDQFLHYAQLFITFYYLLK